MVTFAIIFLVAMAAVGGFAYYLSRTVEHGEARFDTTNTRTKDDE
ncbi:hypothetical protein [Altererythrobacter sp. Z27]